MSRKNDFFEQRLQSLTADLKSYESDIVNHVNSLYGITENSGVHVDLKNDPFGMLAVMKIDVSDILIEAQQRSEYKNTHAKELRQCEALVQMLSHVSNCIDKLNRCDSLISKLSLQSACLLLSEIDDSLQLLLPSQHTEIGSGEVCSLLRREKKLLTQRLHSKLQRILDECVQFEFGRITVQRRLNGFLRSEDIIIDDCTSTAATTSTAAATSSKATAVGEATTTAAVAVVSSGGIQLSSVWGAVTHSEKLTDEVVEAMLQKLWRFLLKPLWNEKKLQRPRMSTEADENSRSSANRSNLSHNNSSNNSNSNNNNSSSGIAELVFDSIARDQGRSFDPHSGNITGSAEDATGEVQHLPAMHSRAFPQLGASRMPIQQLLEALCQIFAFLASEVFTNNPQVAQSVAVKLQAQHAGLIESIIHTISVQLPKSENELQPFRRSLEQPCRELEQLLATFGYFPTHRCSSITTAATATAAGKQQQQQQQEPLTAYLSNLPSIFSDLRRSEILKAARDLVLSDYHNTMLAAGDALEDDVASAGDVGDPRAALDQSGSYAMQKLKFDCCQTSLAACRVLKLLHEVMKQASSPGTSPQVAHVLFQSARDCLDIFIAIVPVHFAAVIDTVPRMGAVFFNDCLYIAHNCTLITHKYRQEMGKIDETLQHTVGFVDFIPRFRSLGEQCMARHLDEQRATLQELVHRIHINPIGSNSSNETSVTVGSSGNTAATAGSSSAAAVASGSRREAARQLLQGGLQQLAGSALQLAVAAAAVTLKSDAIASADTGGSNNNSSNDDESAVLVKRHLERLSSQWVGVLQDFVYRKLMGHLLDAVLQQAMLPILTADCIAETAGSEVARVFRSLQQSRLIFASSGDSDDTALQRICPRWSKFLGLTDLLEYSLSEVAEWLPRKKFAAFTGQEMSQLIRALFEDTPRRQALLTSVLEMSA